MVKQVIVIRKDLNMRKGKMCAQASHAATKIFFDRGTITRSGMDILQIPITPEMKEWIQGLFTKIVVGVNSEDEIYQLAEQARLANLPYAVIVDSGLTEFHNQKTTTCMAIGPAKAEDIDKLTGNLQLL